MPNPPLPGKPPPQVIPALRSTPTKTVARVPAPNVAPPARTELVGCEATRPLGGPEPSGCDAALDMFWIALGQ